MNKVNRSFWRSSFLAVSIAALASLGILTVPSWGRAARNQDSAAAEPASHAKVSLPQGDGKGYIERACADCHGLGPVVKASKTADQWRDTLQDMKGRGAVVPKDQIELMVAYLAENFGPKGDTPAHDSGPTPGSAAAPQLKPGELPPGDGKAIVEVKCSVCHALTNVTDSALSQDDWRDTVQTMIDRGADLSKDDMDTVIRYLAKNFGPKAAPPASGAPATGASSGSSPSANH